MSGTLEKTKWQKWREATKNPPPERLCKISANSYKLNILGTLVTCAFLIKFNLWYVIFAFIFSTLSNWSGYKREMRQYNAIIEAKKNMGLIKEDFSEDPSPTRRKFKRIDKYLGKWVKYFNIAVVAVVFYLFTPFGSAGFLGKILWSVLILITHMIVYVNLIYPIAHFRMKRKVK